MKILYFTDTHINTIGPKSRNDNYEETLEKKFLEIGQIIKNNQIDYVFHGGDLFEKPDVSPRAVIKFGKIMQEYRKKIYIIAGNHDIYGYNIDSIGRTMLGVLDGLGVIEIINRDQPILLNDGNLKIQVSAAPYEYDADRNLEYYDPPRMEGVDYHIMLVHAMLLERKFLDSVDHFLIEDIKGTNCDIVLSGHYHTGFGIKMVNDKYFINPGSLVRTNNSALERNRTPKILILELTKDRINPTLIPLKSAKPGNEVFNETIDVAKLKLESLESFKSLIYQSNDVASYNIIQILKDISRTKKIEDHIVKEAIERLGEVTDVIY